jgi:molybdate transport system substrate-binding protein
MRRRVTAVLAGLLLLSACGTGGRQDVNVYAAASLQDVLGKLITTYESAHADVHLVPALDATSTLRTQIEEGAPADVFLAADTTSPAALHDAGKGGLPVTFAGNVVTMVVPKSNPAGIGDWTDLLKPGISIIAAGETVPITKYAERTIANLAALPEAPEGAAARLDAAIVSREDNVRAVLTKIEAGEGDAAFVYVTDATSTQEVSQVALPDGAAAKATYDGAVIGDSAAGKAFLDWLLTPEAQAIFTDFGFTSPGA